MEIYPKRMFHFINLSGEFSYFGKVTKILANYASVLPKLFFLELVCRVQRSAGQGAVAAV